MSLSAGGDCEWFIRPGSLSRSKSSSLCSHFSPADNQALRGKPHVISRTWFICRSLHHKEETFQISAYKFHSSWFPNFDYTKNDPFCQASISLRSLLTFTMSALNKNLGTSNSVIPQIRNPIWLLMEIDWMGQVSSHPARKNMQMTYICFESWTVIHVHGENQTPLHLQTPDLLGWCKYILWHESSGVVLSLLSVFVWCELASAQQTTWQTGRPK